MAHIEDRWTRGKRNRRRWRARYVGPDGQERSRSFDRKRDAEVWLAAQEAALQRGEWVDPARGRAPFSEVAASWLASDPNKRPTSRARDETVVRVHLEPLLGKLAIAKIKPSHVRAVVERMVDKGLAPKTVRTNYGVLRAIFNWAVEDDLISRSPCRGVRLPEDRPSPKPVVTAADVRRLADSIDPDFRCAVLLGAIGLRLAEVFGLRVGAIDFLRRTLTVRSTLNEVDGTFVEGRGKTVASERTISVPQSVLDELAAHLARKGRHDPEEFVFQSPEGGPVRATNFRNRIYGPALERAELPAKLTFHRLRHSAGHIMREMGVPLEVIQKRLGHRSIRTTADVYGTLPESVDRAVADQLDSLLIVEDAEEPQSGTESE